MASAMASAILAWLRASLSVALDYTRSLGSSLEISTAYGQYKSCIMAASAKVALVTAASAGLGAAIVRALAPHYRVVVNYSLRHEKAQSLIDEVASFPAQYSYAKDQPRSIQSKPMPRDGLSLTDWLTKPVQKMGRLDLVVSNNGWTRVTDFFNLEEQVNEDDWDQCFNINVKSHLWLLYAAKAHLEKSEDGGAFVTVASLAGVRPSGSSLPYSVTKAAEIQLTKGLAIICGKCVRCNSVSPGLMMTEWLVLVSS